MGKILVMTEKPSVGRDFASALACKNRNDGYIEGPGVIITWAIGHLLEAVPPEGYNPELKSWRLEMLPIMPERLKFQPLTKTRKQLGVVKKLVNRKDVESVVIATDAGREGEVIARLILEHSNCRKPLYRFWTSQALTPEIIRYGMQKGLKPAADFDRLYQAGLQRTAADWLVGMNFTRCASIRMGNANGVFSVGRVQTAVLALLVDRKRQRENFKPEPYWIFKLVFENEKGQWVGTWFKGEGRQRENRFWSKEEARQVALKIKGHPGQVVEATKQKKSQAPPPLYSLTVLQRDANRSYGFSAQQTLDIAQSLYEKHQAISYPRTDSQVLGSKNVKMAKDVADRLSAQYRDLFQGTQSRLFSEKNKRIFNDAKLTDHHALIPLRPAKSSFSEAEAKIYDMILTRFAAAFYPDYEFEATEIVTGVNGETFLTRGKVTLKPGWRALYSGSTSSDDNLLPPLTKGDPAQVIKMEGEEKETMPPSEYTEATLLEDMSNPAKYVEENELKAIYRGDVGLGTQATRASIIETLLKRQYASRHKKQILATDKGCALIEFMRQMKVSRVLAYPQETAKWEQMLNAIALGETQDTVFEQQIRKFIDAAVKEFKDGAEVNGAGSVQTREAIGKCPTCGEDVYENSKAFSCRDRECKFVIWKTIAKRAIDHRIVRELLDTGRTSKALKGFKSKQGKNFEARLTLGYDEQRKQMTAQFDFGN